jgi:L,D-transpeptidase ErfK/SrfK
MLANPTFHKARRSRNGYSPLIFVGAVLALTLIVGLICGWLMLQTVASYYASRIYPNVYVMGLKLGRMTPEEATTLLNETARHTDIGLLTLRDGSPGLTTGGSAGLTTGGENHWSIPWSQAGMQLDVKGTVEAAFAIGHTGDLDWRDHIWEWLKRHDVAPVFTVEPERARQVLEQLAPSLASAPIDATLRLPEHEDDPVVAVPGQPGRELDIEATLAQLLTLAHGQGGKDRLDLVFRTIPPRIADATPFQVQAEEMLNRRIAITTYDVLTDETFAWTLGRRDLSNWLRIAPRSNGPTITLDQEAMRMTLTNLAAEMGAGRGLRWAEAVGQLASAFEAGGGTVTLYLTHPVRIHSVQAGDSLSSIAAEFGMTAWHVMQANPGLDPDWLYVGQELTIPSQDELTPYTPVPGKRVIVSIAEQRMRAYENDRLVFEWPVSTGVTKSPTHTGVFQVLGKEEEAYASLWDLWMPHFVAIYAAGPDFFNGFHGLPTLSSGRRLWEGLLGSPASYGCIILGLEEAEAFYNWVELGVVVVVE